VTCSGKKKKQDPRVWRMKNTWSLRVKIGVRCE
jgi:hypothetical protein